MGKSKKQREVTKEEKGGGPVARKMSKAGGISVLRKNVVSGIMSLIAVMFIARRGSTGNPLTYLEVGNESMLRRVFFSGEIWAVACADTTTGLAPDHFEAVAIRLKGSSMRFGVLDCEAKLPSGRSTLQRWKLKREKPIIFVTNGAQVTQLAASSARNEYDLVRELRLAAVRRPSTISNALSLEEKCLHKPRCLLILAGSELDHQLSKSIDILMSRFATADNQSIPIAFAQVDATTWKLDIEGFEAGDAIKLRRYEAGAHRAIYFQNESSAIQALAHYRGGFSESALAAFLNAVTVPDTQQQPPRLVSLDTSPTIIKRPRPKRPPPPPRSDSASDPTTTTDTKAAEKRRKRREDLKNEQFKSKHPDVLTDEDREKLKEQQQRERETKARESMERQAADSAFVTDDFDEPDPAAADDLDHQDDDDMEEDIEEI